MAEDCCVVAVIAAHAAGGSAAAAAIALLSVTMMAVAMLGFWWKWVESSDTAACGPMTGEVCTLWMRRMAEVLLVTNSRISLLGAGSTNITAMAAVTAVPPTRTCHTTYAAASIVGRVTLRSVPP
jgi:hypothetical protein